MTPQTVTADPVTAAVIDSGVVAVLRAPSADGFAAVADVLDRGLAGGFGVPFYPGALTPTEVFTAARDGAPLVKLFPATAVRPGYLKDLHGPLPGVRIMPTGGIGIGDVAAWLTAGASAVGLGGPLLGDAASGGSLSALADRARRAADAVAFARS